EVVDQDSPRAVVHDPVADHGVVLAARYLDPGADGRRAGDAERGHVGVVVVVHEVVAEHRARAGPGRPGLSGRTRTVLGRRGVVVVQAVRDQAGAVPVDLRALDDQVPAGVRPGVPEGAVLHVRIGDHHVAVGAGADVVRGVAHVAGVGVDQRARSIRVAGEDAVLGHRRAG